MFERSTDSTKSASASDVSVSSENDYTTYLEALKKSIGEIRSRNSPDLSDNQILAPLFESLIPYPGNADTSQAVLTSSFYRKDFGSVLDVLDRVDSYVESDIDVSVKLAAFAYVQRFCEKNPEEIHGNTMNYLVMTGLLIADKISKDDRFTTHQYADAVDALGIDKDPSWVQRVAVVYDAILQSESANFDASIAGNNRLSKGEKKSLREDFAENVAGTLTGVFRELKETAAAYVQDVSLDRLFEDSFVKYESKLKEKLPENYSEEVVNMYFDGLKVRSLESVDQKRGTLLSPSLKTMEVSFLKGIDYRCHLSAKDILKDLEMKSEFLNKAAAANEPTMSSEHSSPRIKRSRSEIKPLQLSNKVSKRTPSNTR